MLHRTQPSVAKEGRRNSFSIYISVILCYSSKARIKHFSQFRTSTPFQHSNPKTPYFISRSPSTIDSNTQPPPRKYPAAKNPLHREQTSGRSQDRYLTPPEKDTGKVPCMARHNVVQQRTQKKIEKESLPRNHHHKPLLPLSRPPPSLKKKTHPPPPPPPPPLPSSPTRTRTRTRLFTPLTLQHCIQTERVKHSPVCSTNGPSGQRKKARKDTVDGYCG